MKEQTDFVEKASIGKSTRNKLSDNSFSKQTQSFINGKHDVVATSNSQRMSVKQQMQQPQTLVLTDTVSLSAMAKY